MSRSLPKSGGSPRRLGAKRLGAEQLRWVLENRQGPVASARAGVALGRAEVEASASDRRAREVFDAINALVDTPFRAYCRFDSFSGGVVRILVYPPEKHYDIRSVWQARLLRELAQPVRRGAVRKIVFVPLRDDDADRLEGGGVVFPPR